MTFFQRLNVFLRGHRKMMAASVFFGLVFAGTGLIPPLLIRQILLWHAEGRADAGAVTFIAVGMIVVYVARGASRYLYGLFSHLVAFRAQHAIMVEVYRHIQSLPHRFFADQRVGHLVSRSVGDVEEIEDFIAHGIPETTLAIAIPTSMIAALFFINWQLTLITLIPIPFLVVLTRYVFPRLRGRWRHVREAIAQVTAAVTENISGIQVIKAFVREDERLADIREKGQRYTRELTRTQVVTMAPIGVIELIAGIGLILVIAIGGRWTLEGFVLVADLFVFVVYVNQIYQPIVQLASTSENIQKAIASTDRTFELLDIKSDLVDRPGVAPPVDPTWTVDFDQVHFRYIPDEPVLEGVSFHVEEGKMLALVGPTGVGKSTCAHLLPRFYDVIDGAIRISGVDIRDVPMRWLREHIAMVLQEVFLFEGTIWENIRFGRPDASDNEIMEAARAANVDEFAERFPNGYQSRIGERGVRLSGGQQQRISIARAILKDAPILILDEATSSVDAETEGLIQEALARLTHHRTTIVIAHRLSTIRRADQIVVLRGQRVTEAGTHDELMAMDGWYSDMVRLQQGFQSWQLNSAPDRTVDTVTT